MDSVLPACVFDIVCREPVDVVAPAFERQVAEHVVERPVLHHQDDDVLDLLEVLGVRVRRGRDGRLPGRRRAGFLRCLAIRYLLVELSDMVCDLLREVRLLRERVDEPVVVGDGQRIEVERHEEIGKRGRSGLERRRGRQPAVGARQVGPDVHSGKLLVVEDEEHGRRAGGIEEVERRAFEQVLGEPGAVASGRR